MKKILLYLITTCNLTLLFSQGQEIKDIEIPSAPAFILLDNTTSTIENPKNTKALTLSLLNGIAKDVAIEVTPYFFLKKDKSFYNYQNFFYDEKSPKKYVYKPFTIEGIYSNFSFSVATVKKDSVRSISVGARTKFLNVKSEKFKEAFYNAEDIKTEMQRNIDNKEKYDVLNEKYNKLLDAIFKVKPLVSIDGAVAYSHSFENDDFSSDKPNRFGAWFTLDYNQPLEKDITNYNNYFSIYLFSRYMNEKNIYDVETLKYYNKDFFDLGVKFQLQFDRLSFAYEYIKRTGDGADYRSVGSVNFKINENIAIEGGFGRNFQDKDNLVTIFGLRWGLNLNNEFAPK